MRQESITSWTGQLIKSLGRPREPIIETSLHTMHVAKDYSGMVRNIREQLRLNMRLRLGLVNAGGPAEAPAWIGIPDPMPAYGTRAFREQTLTMYVRKSFLTRAPSGTVICAMSHELSHVVLDAIGHPLRRQEEAVDLTAMLLGFRDVFVRDSAYESVHELHGRSQDHSKVLGWVKKILALENIPDLEITTHHLGYLSHEEREYAAWIMGRWP